MISGDSVETVCVSVPAARRNHGKLLGKIHARLHDPGAFAQLFRNLRGVFAPANNKLSLAVVTHSESLHESWQFKVCKCWRQIIDVGCFCKRCRGYAEVFYEVFFFQAMLADFQTFKGRLNGADAFNRT